MWTVDMYQVLLHLSRFLDYVPAVLITLSIAVLLGVAVGCMCEPCEENDDIFHHEVV